MSVIDQNVIGLDPRISEAEVSDYIALLKPRVMSLVIFTALVGLMIAPGHFHPVLAFTSLLCIAVGAGASGALNMALEGDIDAKMSRTANRPIPRGRITQSEATAFGMTLAFFSVMTLGILVNWYAGALLAFTIFFYVVVYTMWLKRWTAQNIVIGGAAGALPPVVAWVAATVEVEHAMDLLACGQRSGYLLKSRVIDVEDFIETLKRLVRGASVVDPALVAELVSARRADDPLEVLSPREREVLALMAEGRSNSGISTELWVTEGTVEKHVRSILMKLRLPESRRYAPARPGRPRLPRRPLADAGEGAEPPRPGRPTGVFSASLSL